MQYGRQRHTKVRRKANKVSFTPVEKKVKVEISDSWCRSNGAKNGLLALYNDDGKMMQYSVMRAVGNRGITMELTYSGNSVPKCRIFAVDELYRPTAHEIDVNLERMI